MKRAQKKSSWFKILLKIYVFLFIFTMVNRELKPVGFDLRFVVLPLGIAIIFCELISGKKIFRSNKDDSTGNNLLIFYVFAFLCNICWFFNDFGMDQTKFINEMILLVNTFTGLLVFYLYRKDISFQYVLTSMIISCLVLSLSIILSYLGVPFESMMGDASEANIYYGNDELQQKNILGDNYRVAGYASDANYATMLLLFGVISTLKLKKIPKYGKCLLLLVFASMIGLSFSKTILIASGLVLVYMFICKKSLLKTKTRRILDTAFIIFLVITILVMPLLKDILPRTLTLRFAMWDGAKELFFNNPIFGNGITSFRSFFELSHRYWYVQCHSTFWQILSEVGLIGMFFYIRALVCSLNNKKTATSYFLTSTFIIWSATYETIALPLSLFPLYILELENNDRRRVLREGDK